MLGLLWLLGFVEVTHNLSGVILLPLLLLGFKGYFGFIVPRAILARVSPKTHCFSDFRLFLFGRMYGFAVWSHCSPIVRSLFSSSLLCSVLLPSRTFSTHSPEFFISVSLSTPVLRFLRSNLSLPVRILLPCVYFNTHFTLITLLALITARAAADRSSLAGCG